MASSLPLATGAAEAPPTAVAVLDLELEAALATKPDLYLRVDFTAKTLEIRARGKTLETMKLQAADFLVHSHGEGEPVDSIALPAVWTIAGRAPSGQRKVIAPRELRPYSDEEEPPASPPATATPPGAKPERAHKPPASYQVRLDNGWRVQVGQESPLPPEGLEKWKREIRAGWDILLGERTLHPNLVSLVISAEDAQRLHHLFQPGRALLLVGER